MTGVSVLVVPGIVVPTNGVSSGTLPSIIIGGYGSSSASLPAILGLLVPGSTGTLPAWAGVSEGDPDAIRTLPAILANSVGVTGGVTNPSSPTLVLPAITGVGAGSPGVLGESVGTLPAWLGDSHGPGESVLALPAITAISFGATGQIGLSSRILSAITAISLGETEILGASSASVPGITGSGVGLAGVVGVSALILLPPAAAGVGLGGIVGTSVLALPATASETLGGALAIGASVLVLPRIIALGRGDAGVAAYYAVAMQTETAALTTYTDFPFNTLAVFNGKPLGAGPSGLFLLEGADDAGVAIAAIVRPGITDFDTSFRKRVPRVYVGGRFDGDMVLRVITDETHTRDYPLRSTNASGLHGNTVKIGRGVNSRYWQFEIQNTNGCDFDIDTIECLPDVTRRRIGGRDA